MKLPRDLDADTLIRALARIGYRVSRQTGSHIRLQCEHPEHALTIPNHRPLRVGTLSAILADIVEKHGTDRESLLQLPKHEEHQDVLEWIGGGFDPAAFDIDVVNEELALLIKRWNKPVRRRKSPAASAAE